jgi:hypothetical protein
MIFALGTPAMSWFIDNANIVYILLGIVALGFITAFWLNKRVKFLAYAGIFVLLIGAMWLLATFVPTDRKEIHQNVETMADAVVRGDDKELFKHISREFRHNELNREQLTALFKGIVAQYKVGGVNIRQFDCDEVSREKALAKAHFNAYVFDAQGSPLRIVLCLATFAREDDHWKLRAIEFREPAHPDQPVPGAP